MVEANEAARKERFEIAAAAAAVASGLGGMGVAGWFGEPWEPGTAILIAALGAVAAGCIEASTIRRGLFSAASFLMGGMVFAAAVAWYVSDRRSIIKIELLIPFGIALVPFAVARWGFKKLLTQPADSISGRDVVVLACVLGLCFAVGASAYLPLTTAKSESEEHAERSVTIDFTVEGSFLYRGKTLDERQLKAFLESVAATEPSAHVIVRVPKDMDSRVGISKVLPTAMSLGLSVDSIEAPAGNASPKP